MPWVWGCLGLGVVGSAVLLHDAQDREFAFEGVVAASESGGEDESVVGQRGGGDAVGVAGGTELGDDVGSGDRGVGGAADQEPGVVVDEAQDLDVGAVGEGDAGEVRLPAFVRQVSFEPEVGALGSLARLGRDQARARQDPPDRRDRRCADAGVFQVRGDRVGSGVQSCAVRLVRSAMTASMVACSVAREPPFGRAVRFSTASQPPSRHRATTLPTQTLEIPCCRVTAPWDCPASTASTMTRFFDIPAGLTMSCDRG